MNRTLITAALLSAFWPTSGFAGLKVTFGDGAPKDTFRIANTSECATGPVTLTIHMTSSTGKLIFDVTSAGAGVEVFQPLELTKGASFLNAFPVVQDGQQMLVLDINSVPGGEEIVFTIDVDDTIGAREITVTGSEMSGSALMVQTASATVDSVFDATATAVVATPACTS